MKEWRNDSDEKIALDKAGKVIIEGMADKHKCDIMIPRK
ncbi:hypothetical protein BSM4216_0715 [Bacillus smithii]|nr:hypothetical protein BSM4216_0715 [Bacillus smithii]